MYVPSFTEIFLGFLLVVGWVWALQRRAHAPGWTRSIPWLAAVLLLAGQVIAGLAILGVGGGPAMVGPARWGSVAAIGLALLACGAATVSTVLRAPRKSVLGDGATGAEGADRADPAMRPPDSSE